MNGFRNDYHHTPAGGYRSGDDRGDAGDGWSQGGPYPPVSEIFASAAEKVNEMRKQPVRGSLGCAEYMLMRRR
jgi:hypothetical protein